MTDAPRAPSAWPWALLGLVLLVPDVRAHAVLPVLVGLGLLVSAVGARDLGPRRGLVLAALALALGVGALWHPERLPYAAATYALFPLLAATTVAAARTFRSPDAADGAAAGLAVWGALAGAWCVVERLLDGPGVGAFGRAGVAGPAFAAVLPAAALLAARDGRRALGVLCAALVVGGLAVSGSRTAWAAAAVGVVASLLAARASRRAVVLTVATLALAAGLLVALRPSALAGETVRVRRGLAAASARLVAERPGTGHGPGSFSSEVLRVRDLEEARISAGRRPFAAHDDYLHLAVEGGLPAGAALVALIAVALATAWRARRAPWLGALAALAVAALAEDPFLEAHTLMIFGLGAGAAAGAAGGRTAAPPLWVTRTSLAVAGALLVTLGAPMLARANGMVAVEEYERAKREGKGGDVERLADHDRHAPALYRHAVGLGAVEHDDAPSAYRRALEVDPGLTEARLDLAELARLDGKREEARAILEEARRRDPTRFDVPLRLGHLTLGEEPPPGERAEPEGAAAALRLYNEADSLAPGRFEVRVAFARLYRRTGNLPQAAAELAEAQRIAPDEPEILLEGFRLAEAQGVPREALRGLLVERVLARGRPAQTAALRAEVARLTTLGLEEETAARGRVKVGHPPDLRRARSLYDAAGLRIEGLLLSGRETPRAVRDAAAEDARDGRHLLALARFRALLSTPAGAKDADLVLEAARSAYRVDPAEWRRLSAWGHELLGAEMLAKDDLPAALREYHAAVDKDPGAARPRVGLAKALARAGRPDEARAELGRALAIDGAVESEARDDPDLAPLLPR